MENNNYNIQNDDDMADEMFWRPIVDNDAPLLKRLKWILKEEGYTDRHLSTQDLGFLNGLRAAEVEGVAILIEAIEKYGYIELYTVGI